jgi:arylsulfatase A-like enzyme
VGVGPGEAVLVPLLYFAIDMLFSAAGGLFLVIPRRQPAIVVADPEREERVHAEIPVAPPEAWPKLVRGLSLGFGAGLLGGMLLGLGEAAVVLASSGGAAERSVLVYGGVTYGLFCATGGAAAGLLLAWTGRLMKREAVAESTAFARMAGLGLAAPAFAIAAFRIRRDVFEEQLVWKSAQGLGVAAACALGALLLYLIVATALRLLTRTRAGAWLLRAWGTPALAVVALGVVTGVSLGVGAAAGADGDNRRSGNPDITARPAAPGLAGPILLLVVDTLRADHLPAYGYEDGHTPNLDAFAREAVRFEHAYANASWTRPSFATILTGSYPSRHQTMAKSASLPEAIVTLPEALARAGYVTAGVVTNYNVAPFFRFDQGFDRYRYLEPAFVLGADDTAAKLLFIQFARQQIEKIEELASGPRPGRAYRDAAEVNRAIAAELDRMPEDRPFFLFAGYMDPHDPYFPHADTPRGNVGGVAFSRAANQRPDLALAPRLRALYDGEITFWDRHFGELLEDLRRRGLYDRATIIVTSDHGEEFGEHGGFWHGTTLYDEQVHVPLFVKLPMGQYGGTTRREWVQHVDLMPTVLRLAGADVPEGVQGHDVFDRSVTRDEVFAEESHEGNVLRSLRVRRGPSELKLITANEGNPRGLQPVELYRVDLDPGERVNLEGELTWEREHLARRLEGAGDRASVGRVEREDVAVRGEDEARLRALGYAGGAEAGEALEHRDRRN